MVNFHLLLLIMEFSKSIMNFMELFLTSFKQDVHLLCSLKKLIISLMDHFVCPAVLIIGLLMIVNDNRSFEQGESFAWQNYWCRFLDNQSTQEIEDGSIPVVWNIRKEVRNFMVKLIEKLREWSSLKYSPPLCFRSLSSIISTQNWITCKQVQKTFRMFVWIWLGFFWYSWSR